MMRMLLNQLAMLVLLKFVGLIYLSHAELVEVPREKTMSPNFRYSSTRKFTTVEEDEFGNVRFISETHSREAIADTINTVINFASKRFGYNVAAGSKCRCYPPDIENELKNMDYKDWPIINTTEEPDTTISNKYYLQDISTDNITAGLMNTTFNVDTTMDPGLIQPESTDAPDVSGCDGLTNDCNDNNTTNQDLGPVLKPYPLPSLPPLILPETSVPQSDNCTMNTDNYCSENKTEDNSIISCSCHEDCNLYGDCCWSATIRRPLLSTNREALPRETDNVVVEMGLGNLIEKRVLMMTRCPQTWERYDGVRMQCEVRKYGSVDEDYFLQIPVTGTKSHITYRNIFCAICHQDFEFVPWKVKYSCPNNSYVNQTTNSSSCKNPEVMGVVGFDLKSVLLSESGERDRWNKPRMVFSVPEEVVTLVFERKLHSFYVEDCSEEWVRNMTVEKDAESAREIVEKCLTYLSPVISKPLEHLSHFYSTYKNKYCAICMGVPEDQLGCENRHPDKLSDPIFQNMKEKDNIEDESSEMNFLSIGVDFANGGLIFPSKERCPPQHLYDPIRRRCRYVSCGKKYVLRNKKCVPNVSS